MASGDDRVRHSNHLQGERADRQQADRDRFEAVFSLCFQVVSLELSKSKADPQGTAFCSEKWEVQCLWLQWGFLPAFCGFQKILGGSTPQHKNSWNINCC